MRFRGLELPCLEVEIAQRPFYSLLEVLTGSRRGPRVLVVSPLSGHRIVLLRDLVAALVPCHSVFVIEWRDASLIPAWHGPFGLDENIDCVLEVLRLLGPDLHLIALSQSPVPCLAATALAAMENDAPQPKSLTLISGFLDPGLNPTRVARFVNGLRVETLAESVIETVPDGWPGAGRLVYPATTQKTALGCYLARHLIEGRELLWKMLWDDSLARRLRFLRAYFDVQDLAAEIFLDTVDKVFHQRLLPRGRLMWRGVRIVPEAIMRTALMTVEGGMDDASGLCQTGVAHALCRNVPERRRAHYCEPGVGHFGTFHGRAWRERIAPRVARFIAAQS